MKTFAIWADNFAEAAAPWYTFGMVYGDDPIPPEQVRAGWESSVEYGRMVKGETVEEVIEQLGLPLKQPRPRLSDTTHSARQARSGLPQAGQVSDRHQGTALLWRIPEHPVPDGVGWFADQFGYAGL